MLISTFANLQAQACVPVEIEWAQLGEYLAAPPEYASKHECPLLKLATFGQALSNKGSLRHDANVTAIYGVEGDHDAETMTPEDAVHRLATAGVASIVYTSASHGPTRSRWRVLVPTSQPYAPAAHRELVGRLNAVLGGTLSTESFTLSQSYYFGRVSGVPYACYSSGGNYLDLVNVAPVFPQFAGGGDGDFELNDGPVSEWRGPTDDADLLRRALQSRSAGSTFGNRASFADLWDCNHEVLAKAFPDSKHPFNASEADAALVAHLSFWTGRDGARIDRLMRQSKLARDKWERDDYLPRTISRILSAPGDVLIDKPPEPPSLPAAVGEAPTQQIIEGQTFLAAAAQRDLFNGCVYVTDQHKILVPGGVLLDQGQFRVAFGGYTFAMDAVNERTTRNAWEAFTESQALRAPRAHSVCFKPERAPGELVSDAGRVRANTWWPAEVPRQAGDLSPFLTHLRKVLPDERDQQILLSYMAACVQHKGIKFQWAPVLQGIEGNGKTLFSACVSQAVGQHYTHWVDAKSVTSEFNAYLARVVFLAIEEMYVQEHAAEVVEKMKTIIAGGSAVQIQAKGVDQVSMEICCNAMITTNYRQAVRKTPDNARRFGLFFTAQQTFADLVRDGMSGDYFPDLYDWLKRRNGFAIVSELLHTYPIPPEFNPAGSMHRAPNTSTTDLAIVESRGSVEQQIAEVIAQDTPGFMGGWISTVMLDRLLSDTLKIGNRISHAKRREMLTGMGYVLHPGLTDGRVNNPVQPDGRKPQLFVLASNPAIHMRGAAEIARAYSLAQTLALKV